MHIFGKIKSSNILILKFFRILSPFPFLAIFLLLSQHVLSHNISLDSITQGFNRFYNKPINGTIVFEKKFKELYSTDTILQSIQLTFNKAEGLTYGLQLDVQIRSKDDYKRISFDGKYYYSLNDFTKSITITSDDIDKEFIKKNISFHLRNLPIIDPANYFDQIEERCILESNENYFLLHNEQYTIYLSKKDYSIYKVIEIIHVGENSQYLEILIKSQQFGLNIGNSWLLNDQSLPSDYFITNHCCSDNYKSKICEGIPAPNFTLKNIQDKSVTLGSLRGKIVVLDFWYMECKPCLEVFKVLSEVRKNYGDDVIIIGVNSVNRDKAELLQFMIEHALEGDQCLDSDMVTRHLYDVSVFPTLFIINQRGIITNRIEGYHKKLKSEISDHLNLLL